MQMSWLCLCTPSGGRSGISASDQVMDRTSARNEGVSIITNHKECYASHIAVSKDEVFRFLEQRFALADHNHDGLLDENELALFAYSIACSFRKAKAEVHGNFSESLLSDRSVL
jgi:hypothetical protein